MENGIRIYTMKGSQYFVRPGKITPKPTTNKELQTIYDRQAPLTTGEKTTLQKRRNELETELQKKNITETTKAEIQKEITLIDSKVPQLPKGIEVGNEVTVTDTGSQMKWKVKEINQNNEIVLQEAQAGKNGTQAEIFIPKENWAKIQNESIFTDKK